VDSSTKRNLLNYWSGPWTVVEKLTDLLYRIAPHNEWRTWMKVQVVGIDRLKLYRERKNSNEPDPPIVEPPRQESLLDWEDGAERVEDPDMPYYLGGGGGGQPPPPLPPPPGPQDGGGGVPAYGPVVGGAGLGGVAPGAPPPPAQGKLDDVVQQPAEGGVAEDFPPPQLPDLEMVEDPDAPQGENQEGWQVDADQDEAAGYEGIEGDTYVVRGNGNRVLDAGQIVPYNGEQVGGDQEELAEYHRRIREAEEGVEDGGDPGELAGGDQGAQGRIATGPGSIHSPGNSPPPRVALALTGPEAIQWKL
jgi:hypothetical protein